MKPVSEVPIEVIQYGVIVLPLQGMWNCLIYFRPRYLAYKKKQKREKERAERIKRIKANALRTPLEIMNGNGLPSGSSIPQRTTLTAMDVSLDIHEEVEEKMEEEDKEEEKDIHETTGEKMKEEMEEEEEEREEGKGEE